MASLTSTFANELFSQGASQPADNVIMSRHFVLQQVDSRGRFHAAFVHYVVAIQPLVNHDFIFAKMLLKSFDFGNSRALTKIDTCRR
jgi:hypothetical protein